MTNAVKEWLSMTVFYAMDGETVLEPAPGMLDDNQTTKIWEIQGQGFRSFFRLDVSVKGFSGHYFFYFIFLC